MAPEITIRRAYSQRALNGMHALYSEVFPLDADPGPVPRPAQRQFVNAIQALEPRTQRLHLDVDRCFLHLAAYTADNKLVGALTSEVDRRTVERSIVKDDPPAEQALVWLLRRCRTLGRLGVLPDYRGEGIGLALVHEARRIHRQEGIGLWSGVLETWENEKFFNKAGFTVYVLPGAPPGVTWVITCPPNYVVQYKDSGVAALGYQLTEDHEWQNWPSQL